MFGSKLYYDMIMTSYLKPLSSKNNESKHCKLGHANEKILFNNLCRHHKRMLKETVLDMLDSHDSGIVKTRKFHMLKQKLIFWVLHQEK